MSYRRRMLTTVGVFTTVAAAAILFAPGLREPALEGAAVIPTDPAALSTTTTIIVSGTPAPPMLLSNDGYLPAPAPGDCASYGQHLIDHGLPRDTFLHIAWIESGCNHVLRLTDSDDHGGGLLGFNFVSPELAEYWQEACGMTYENLTESVDRQLSCAAKAYEDYGTEPWENSRP
jgi:hypothetical protein